MSAALDAIVVAAVIVVVFPLVNASPPTVTLGVYPVVALTATYIVVLFSTCVVAVIAVPLELSNFVVNVVFAPCVLVNV